MQVRRVRVRNYRGIAELEWLPSSDFICIVGPGDAGKSTLLDAIEATLSPRWTQFSDADFTGCNPANPIEIEVTVGELPRDALHEKRFGLHLRGWTAAGVLRDEPEGDDEEVVTVRLTVDSTLEPVWELVTDRQEPRVLSSKDRMLFGVSRLGNDPERHLTWGQTSALAKLTEATDEASALLSDAYRTARELVGKGALTGLADVAHAVREHSVHLGAYAREEYGPGLDTQRASMSVGTLALHDGATPVRLAGLGTRRLVSLAIQRMAVKGGRSRL